MLDVLVDTVGTPGTTGGHTLALTAIVERLQHLGMSGYEAKAYVALVGSGVPSNGYEVAKKSGVPRSTVYETLGKLVARGAAFEVKASGDGSTVEYLPLPPRVLVNRLSKEYEESIAELERILPTVTATPQVRLIHDLGNKSALLDCAQDVINASKHELFISAWGTEWDELEDSLLAADRRSVDISALTFGEVGTQVGHCYQHTRSTPEVSLANLGCRMFTVVGDREEAVVGGLTDVNAWGVYTDNPAVVLLAIEYIRHDIAIQLMGEHFDSTEVDRFWKSDPDLERLRSDHGIAAELMRAAHSGGNRPVPDGTPRISRRGSGR